MQEFNVRFMPQNRSVRVPRGTDVLSAAIKCGIMLNASCGGAGLCGKCKVVIERGVMCAEPSPLIQERDRKRGYVLACDAIVESDLEIKIPKESLEVHAKLRHDTEEFTKGSAARRESKFKLSPLVKKVFLELPPPTADDNEGDLERIERKLREKIGCEVRETKIAALKHLSALMRESDFKVTVTFGNKDGQAEILSIEPGDTTKDIYGLAFDIGTTTIVGQLVDLSSGNILGTRISFNRQSSYGGDIITRIVYASEPSGLRKLNDTVLANINEMIEDLTGSLSINIGSIYATICAGNTTMMHLLLNVDPSSIRRAPYVPTTTLFPTVYTAEAKIEANPKGLVGFIPGVGAYVGGDIVAGLLACGLAESDSLSLLVDIGTNGEIVLGNREWMIGAAASAGPAFEGSGLSCGMKATSGAIQKVVIDADLAVRVTTIDSTKPKGICGSGYIASCVRCLKGDHR